LLIKSFLKLYEFVIYRIIIIIFSECKQKIAYKGKFAGDLTNFIFGERSFPR